MTQPIYTPHFAIKAGCRKPSRLHTLYRFALNVTTALFIAFVAWCFITVIALGA